MFNRETVLLLGAGASWHYFFPTGQELVDRMKDIGRILYYEDIDFEEEVKFEDVNIFKNLITALNEQDPTNIDSFLSKNPSFVKAAKFIISHIILSCEKNSSKVTFFESRNSSKGGHGNWYRYLTEEIIRYCDEAENIFENKLSIITFNYDVSLEHYLYNILPKTGIFKGKEELIYKFLKEKLNIIHVYGKVYDVNKDTFCNYGRFSNKGNVNQLKIDAENSNELHLIGEQKQAELYEAEHIIEARQLLNNASRLFILGYGFDSDNNKLLELNKVGGFFKTVSSNKQAFITNYGNIPNVDKKIKKCFGIEKGGFEEHSTVGNTYYSYSVNLSMNPRNTNAIQISERSVYDALTYDFSFENF